MKYLITIITALIMTSCTSAIIDQAAGAGISIFSKALEKEMEAEAVPDSVEIKFPEATVVIEKPNWFRDWLGLYEKHLYFSSESYSIQAIYGKTKIYWTVEVQPVIINGKFYDQGVYSFETDRDVRPEYWHLLYPVNNEGEIAEVNYMETEDLRIMKFQKWKVKIAISR